MKSACLTVCLLLLLLPVELHAWDCYLCVGSNNARCNDPFDMAATGVSTTTCNTFCFRKKTGDVVTRGCSSTCQEETVNGVETKCCNKDKCNSSTKVSSSLLLLLLPLISIFVGKDAF